MLNIHAMTQKQLSLGDAIRSDQKNQQNEKNIKHQTSQMRQNQTGWKTSLGSRRGVAN